MVKWSAWEVLPLSEGHIELKCSKLNWLSQPYQRHVGQRQRLNLPAEVHQQLGREGVQRDREAQTAAGRS